MSCIENINRYVVPNNIIKLLTEVYKYIGRNDFYEKTITSKDMEKVLDQTVESDAFYLSKIINLDITDARLKLLINKTSTDRNKEEGIALRVLEQLKYIQDKRYVIDVKSTNQINDLNFIYDQTKKIDFDFKTIINGKDKRSYLDELTSMLYESDGEVEDIILLSNYFVDIYNLKAFTEHNETSYLMILYLLMLKSELNCFRFVSFFELLYNNLNEFNEKILDASYNWYIGMNQPTSFIEFLLKLIRIAYEKTEDIVLNYKQEQNASKGDNIEATILKNFMGPFTKADIRKFHPYVSESTINRALVKLRDENKIISNGKGRSATWERTNKSNI